MLAMKQLRLAYFSDFRSIAMQTRIIHILKLFVPPFVLITLLVSACGVKGPPLPPLHVTPQHPETSSQIMSQEPSPSPKSELQSSTKK